MPQIDFVVSELHGAGVARLEQLATALLVESETDGDTPLAEKINALREYKPHISQDQADDAFKSVAAMRERALAQGLVAEVG